jgi:predicted nucleic acid-binding protein
MATTGVRRAFVDTNVLVYANVSSAPLHQQAQTALQNLWNGNDELWISRQVIREYAMSVTRPQTFMQPMSVATVIARVQYFEKTFEIADDTSATTAKLLELMKTITIGGKQVHDANIVATMLVNQITHLLTHNTGDFSRYSHLITIVPL